MRPSGIGGQAVMEGIMMKNKNQYAIAVRKPDKEIVVQNKEYISVMEKHKILGLPILRGVIVFVESLVVGMKSLNFAASFFEEEEKVVRPAWKEKVEWVFLAIVAMLFLTFSLGIFIILPYFAAEFIKTKIESNLVRAIIEGVIRLAIFILYIVCISFMNDIKRVFMYHGAEHKTINCLENGERLTVENIRKQSRHHKRCGTSFLLYVIIISIIFFACIRVENSWLKIALRVLLVPVISGVAYEFIRLAGRSESGLVRLLSKPGMWMQRLTTREPDDDMIEVAIQSVEAVLDWEDFIKGGDGKIQKNQFPRSSRMLRRQAMMQKNSANIDKSNGTNEIENENETEVTYLNDRRKKIKKISKNEDGSPREVTYDEFDDDEEDEVLRALDKYFESSHKPKKR